MGDIDAPRSDIEHFANELSKDTVKSILGTHLDDGERVRKGLTPRTTFFSGAIVPKDEGSPLDEDIESKVSPSTIGIIGQIGSSNDLISVEVVVSFALYYRVVPYPTQVIDDEKEVPIVYRKKEVGPVKKLITLPANKNTQKYDKLISKAEDDIKKATRKELKKTKDKIKKDPSLMIEDFNNIDFLQDNSELDVDEFKLKLEREKKSKDFGLNYVPDPSIEFDIRILEGLEKKESAKKQCTDITNSATVRIDINNSTEKEKNTNYEEVDNALYETQLELHQSDDSELIDIEFEQLPDNFRYDPFVPGHGHNCSVESTEDGSGIKTVTVPIYKQPYFEHSELDGDAKPRFDRLMDDPLPVLRSILSSMRDYRYNKNNGWQAKLNQVENTSNQNGTKDIIEAVRESIKKYEKEIERFESGIKLLEQNKKARELFKLTNKVFYEKVKKREPVKSDDDLEYTAWRPFQIVFIVTVLPDIIIEENDLFVDNNNRDNVSLLYFPTGGGKTEAYLALLVFSALFDRLRGKKFGVTSMMRFPLRLLSLQQFQRVVEILNYADKERIEQGYGGDPFGVGYLTGATENKLLNLINKEYDNSSFSYPKTQEKLDNNKDLIEKFAREWNNGNLNKIDKNDYLMVNNCPLCGVTIELVFNENTARIEHQCPNKECENNKLNVYVLDRDIYRRLPTMILGTQDKLAAIGYEYRFRTVCGHISHYCEDHGYTHSNNDCLEPRICGRDKSYTDHELQPVEPYDPAPTLTIQDELHLVNEELGTFESHYYSAIEKHFEWAYEMHDWGDLSEYKHPKKIAATATIEESDNQVRHLYLNDVILFPSQGPEYRESFYSTKDENRTQRIYIGVAPWNRSQINSIVRTLEIHQKRLKDMLEDPESAIEDFDFDHLEDEDTFVNLVSHYYTLVNYVISKNEGARVYKSAENQVNDNLRRESYKPLDRFELTGDTNFKEISEMLSLYENIGNGKTKNNTYKDIYGLIVSTSSISHGVDLESLNFMLFFNAPPRMAEYIQASSRVGRRYPGIVLDMFHPIQERDRSHYHYFHKYHEYLDRLVEPVAVNRWAKFSVNRTFPGLFMSILYQRDFNILDENLSYFNNYVNSHKLKKAADMGLIDQDSMIDDLVEIYGQDWRTGKCPFKDRLDRLVNKSFNQIINEAEKKADDCLIGRKMTSLRDIDEQIYIKPSKNHEEAFRSIGVGVRY